MSDETYIVARRKHGERVGGQKQGDMLESSGCSVTEGRGKENGAVDCVEDVWLAVQRRRPGVPRRSFGISLTPPLIISLFLCGLAGFVAGLGMHLIASPGLGYLGLKLRMPYMLTILRVKCVRSMSFINHHASYSHKIRHFLF